MVKTKWCTKCGENLEVGMFHKASANNSGRYSVCKVCAKEVSRLYYLKNKVRINATNKSWRDANPNKVKAAQAQHYINNRDDLLLTHAEYRSRNKATIAVSSREYTARNKEVISEKAKIRYRENREIYADYGREYRQNNRDKVNARGREYYENNKGAALARGAKRRAVKKQAIPVWMTKADEGYIRDLYINCREFEEVLLGVGLDKKFHVDHIIPLTSGVVCGLHHPHNLQILSSEDNLSKGNRYSEG